MQTPEALRRFLASLIDTPAYRRLNARDVAHLRACRALIQQQEQQISEQAATYRAMLAELIDTRVRLQTLTETVQAGLQLAQAPDNNPTAAPGPGAAHSRSGTP